ncbi:MAG: 30S ribosomal protein S3 [Nanoarchaeota archaeon]|nr:30S ribosomal protein S3 [Nanoarchaeota archaeon]MBU4241885.1 30S ribosomal protein S3 [Nanoarchaeota archaeon]MBU4352473.1 30S ribosomal protein S3 [Nanoarchaeota archaeon]MBU4455998.1 30S ribosomal protein S3 [Nanoarchaeota archaeon]MCG2719417.1 30S ribosomal protein S3 [Nanoarchaeota archaeon]
MIERKFVGEKLKILQVEAFIAREIGKDKYSFLDIKKTPLGEKIIIFTAKPGLVVGKKGETIKKLTQILKSRFKMENPQIEVAEVPNPDLDAQSMAEFIGGTLERFGPKRFKSVGYKALQRIIDAGAMGAEIVISGRGVPSSRAKSWRFYEGYLKKSGDVSETLVSKGIAMANLKSGTVGIKVRIMPPGIELPDSITINDKEQPVQEEIKVEEIIEEVIEEKPNEKKKPVKAKKEDKPKKETKAKKPKVVKPKKEESKKKTEEKQ